ILQVLLMLAAIQPIRNWQSGAQLSKEYNALIAKLVTAIMGVGVALHAASFWVSDPISVFGLFSFLVSHLGIALVGAGLLLSFLPAEYTASPSKKSA
ncbi:MAG: hypothetical protein ACKVKM_08530, partial [Verrucomicrobiia bacterium]